MVRCFVFVCTTMAVVSIGRAQVQPVLTVSFDKDFDGTGKAGRVKGMPEGNPVLVPGKFGQALKAGPTVGQMRYPTRGVLSRSSGTVEMWVSPVDWSSDDGKFHVFFEMRGQGSLYLYEYWQGSKLLMLTCDDEAGPYTSSVHPTGWKPGEWHHIAGTWSAKGVLCYVDGKPAGLKPLPGRLPKVLAEVFYIGDLPWQFERTSATLVDEVRVYDRALMPAHIAAHYAGNHAFTVPLSAKTSSVDYTVDLAGGRLEIAVYLGGADVDDARVRTQVALVPPGQALPDDAPLLPFTGGLASTTRPLPGDKPGEHVILARVMLDGKPAFELKRPFVVPSTEWLGNTLGLADKVLPPWTPMQADANHVQCWGRDYQLGDSPMPVQITSRDRALLARAPVLRLARGKQVVAWQTGTRSQTLSRARTKHEATGHMAGMLGDAPVRVNVRTTTEYDGLMLVELSLAPVRRPDLDTLVLDIPVKAEHAICRHRYARTWAGLTGYLSAKQGVVDQTRFIPYYWLGDNDRGLFWMCESDEMWPNGQEANAIEVVRHGEEVILRLNVLAAGQKLPARWRFVFGLQATPVKPIPKDWRKYRMTPGRNANVHVVWPKPKRKDSFKYFGYPQATDPAQFAAHIDGIHAKGQRTLPYLCLTFITDAIPEWRYYRRIWEMGPVDDCTLQVGWGHRFPMVSPVAKGYSDFIAWTTYHFLKRYGIDGLYHDQTHPYTSKNVVCGVGYMRNGKAHYAHPILGFRALYRRIYAIQKELFPDSFTQAHMSGKVMIPVLAYDDSYLDGEHFRDKVKDSYMDVVSLDTFRAEFIGRQWGIIPFFLPEFRPPHSTQVEPTRGMMALLMIHDVSVWPIWCNAKVANEALGALDAFGYVDAEFIPYFDPTPPATTDMADVYVSAYKRADGRALLVVGNLSREDRTGPVRINAKRLGLPLDQVTSWPDKKAVHVSDDQVTLDVPRLGYRMLVVARH